MVEAPNLSPIFRDRLSKKCLLGLPEGALLQSNASRGDSTPVFAETIGDKASREELWERLRALGLSGTLFYAFRDAEAYRLSMTMRGRPF
jgi:hypothetical protein